jgi:hypothetical protein
MSEPDSQAGVHPNSVDLCLPGRPDWPEEPVPTDVTGMNDAPGVRLISHRWFSGLFNT